jgi:hypothetical protein
LIWSQLKKELEHELEREAQKLDWPLRKMVKSEW